MKTPITVVVSHSNPEWKKLYGRLYVKGCAAGKEAAKKQITKSTPKKIPVTSENIGFFARLFR